MRKHLSLIAAVLLLAACSSPKYTYNFDYYDYNSGKKQKSESTLAHAAIESIESEEIHPLVLNEEMIVASASETPVVLAEPETRITAEEAKSIFEKKYKAMTKEEKKEFRQELKKEIKAYSKAIKKGDTIAAANATKAMDQDLKLAIIFGAVGLIFGIIGGDVFWVLSAIAWIVAIVFFIKWVVRQ